MDMGAGADMDGTPPNPKFIPNTADDIGISIGIVNAPVVGVGAGGGGGVSGDVRVLFLFLSITHIRADVRFIIIILCCITLVGCRREDHRQRRRRLRPRHNKVYLTSPFSFFFFLYISPAQNSTTHVA